MIIYTAQTTVFGYAYSNLVVTYPPELAPNNVVQVALAGVSLCQLDYLQNKAIRAGEIPSAIPFKVASQVGLKGISGLVLLADEDFQFHPEDKLIFETRQITLVCMNTDLEFPTDGLHYIINLLDKNKIRTKDFLISLYIYNSRESRPSNALVQELLESNNRILRCDTLASKLIIKESDLLPFVNLSKTYFKEFPQRLILSSPHPKNVEKSLSTKLNNFLLDWHNNYFSVDYRKSISLLKSSPNIKPNIVKPDKTNDILLRSILVSNWLMNAKDSNVRVLAARLIYHYNLRLKTWQERVATDVWSGKWEDVSWMGRMAISWSKERKEDNDSKKTISLIKRRTLLFLIYPAFLGFCVWGWLFVLNNMPWNGLFPLVGLISTFLVPRLGVGILYAIAKLKMEHPVKLMSTFGFVLGGLVAASNISYQNLFKPNIAIYLSLALWLIWVIFPILPKFGKLLFDLIVFVIPIMAFSLGHNFWERYIALTQNYTSNLISNLYEVLGSLIEVMKEIMLSSSQ